LTKQTKSGYDLLFSPSSLLVIFVALLLLVYCCFKNMDT